MQSSPLQSVFPPDDSGQENEQKKPAPPRRIVLGRTITKSGRRMPQGIPAPAAAPVRAAIFITNLERLGGEDGWLRDGQSQRRSQTYFSLRRTVLNNLLWFLRHTDACACGTRELRGFFAYLSETCPGGRWGNPRWKEASSVSTVRTYHAHLCILFQWLVEEGALDVTPMERVKAPRAQQEAIIPFSGAQFNALLQAAARSVHPARDRALLLFLVNTGVRASELCGLKERDMDWTGLSATVLGKGNKRRLISFHIDTKRALWDYRRRELCGGNIGPDTPLFLSERGTSAGQELTRSGLQKIVMRLARVANLPETVRARPHTFRHTFAYQFLRKPGNDVKTLQAALSHTDLKMTMRYVHMTDIDVRRQQSGFSPTAWTKNEDF